MSAEPVEWLLSYVDYRRRLFASGAHCALCAVADPVVLVLRSEPLVCRGCLLARRTGRRTELHHLGGRPSWFVVEVDANVHAWLSLFQRGWRGSVDPGSLVASVLDLVALVLVSRFFDGVG